MKLVFKNKEEFENFCTSGSTCCPSELGGLEFMDHRCVHVLNCVECWEQSGIEIIFEDEQPKVAYLCDENMCDCNNPDCKHTTDITHAVNFEYFGDNKYMEKEIKSNKDTNKIKFILNGCDISFIAEEPADITLEQLLKQCDKIKPDWCACGICSYAEMFPSYDYPTEIEIGYDSIKKTSDDVSCRIVEE